MIFLRYCGKIGRLLNAVGWVFFAVTTVGCQSVPPDASKSSATGESVFVSIQVKSIGSNPRSYPLQVRFVALTHRETNSRLRMQVNSDSNVIFLKLPAGNYSVDRVQFNEGPFMGESHVHFNFYVSPGRITYLGEWQFEVETPRTIRRVRIHLSEGAPEAIGKIADLVNSEHSSMETVVPEPDRFTTRVYSVSPIPRAKYFRRR